MIASSAERIAIVRGVDSATLQILFEEAVTRWRACDIRVVGVIEEQHGLPGRTCNAGVLRDIVSGEPYSIYLEVPPRNTACHIDATGAENACAVVLPQIETCDLVVLSKFGKLEAAGGGLLSAFEAAMAEEKPVLTTVSNKHLDAWRAFAPTATALPARAAALQEWWSGVRS